MDFNNLVLIITDNIYLYAIPMYVVALLYVVFILGWFFSTDYYDTYIVSLDDDSEFVAIMTHLVMITLNVVSGLCIFHDGIESTGSINYITFLWVMVVVPVAAFYLYKLRTYLRKKRGKL